MLCEDVMTRHVVGIGADDSVKEAARKMRDLDIGFLPVWDPRTHRVVGVITDRDIAIRLVAEDLSAQTRVVEVMSPEVVWCRPDDDVITAERIMGRKQKSRILCIDEGQVVGVISLADIASKEDEPRLAETVRQVTRRELRSAPHE